MQKLLAAILLIEIPLHAWGPVGHRLVARIADVQLTAATRARVAEILGPDRTMWSVASWADDVRIARRQTAQWHFINIPIIHKHLDMARDCPNNDCVLTKMPELRKILQDPTAPQRERSEALMFLIHFIGDVHQPLHCANYQDHGGNLVPVRFAGRNTNLHSVWDSGILVRIGTEEQLFPAMANESAKRAKKWRKGAFAEWVAQSHEIAQKNVYGKLSSAADNTPRPIDSDYERMAGARLARILNETLQ